MPDSRRLPGEIASEQLTQANVHMRDMITTRCQPGTAYDEDNGLPVSIALSSPVGSCTTAGGTVAKVVNITNFADFELQPGIEISVYFSNKNTANNPTLNVAGTGAIPICLAGQASNVSLGEGCILPGIYQFKYIDVTVGGTRHQNWLLLNSDVAARGTDSTIYADGTSVYKPFFYKMGKEVTFEEIDRCFGLNRTYKGYKVECTCYNQGATSYASGVLINTTWNTYQSKYISISSSSNKLIASTTVSGQENNVCWSIYPIEVVSIY